jgi:Holliday junction resolvase RusA-like endonuclease
MGMIQFTVYGEPVAQGRPRFTTINGHAKAYDPAKSRDYKQYVRLVASQHKPDKPLEGALALQVNIYRSIPKSFSKKKHTQAENGEIRPTTKPDVDNFLKVIKDALKGIVWKDDSQVVSAMVNKWYSEQPRVEVTCYRLEGDRHD